MCIAATAFIHRFFGSLQPPAVWFGYSPDRKGCHPQAHLSDFSGVLQADVRGSTNCINPIAKPERSRKRRAGRKIHDVHVRTPSVTIEEALHRIGELYVIEGEIREQPAALRLEERQRRSKPLLAELEGWLREK